MLFRETPRSAAFPGWSLLLLLIALLVVPAGAWAAMAEVGEPAPPVRVRDLEGQTVVLEAVRPDRALLVMFSTVGCVPCRESEPILAAAGEKLAGELDVACVMLADRERVRAMLATGAAPELPFYADSVGKGLFPTADAYGVMGTPTTFLVGRDGRVLWRHVGRITSQQLEEAIPAALDRDGGADGVAASRLPPAAN